MLPGPVFFHELRSTARKRRSFVYRTLIGLFLLYLLIMPGSRATWRNVAASDWEYSAEELARLGGNLFANVVGLQAALILLLTPAFVAGAIVEDRQRKVLTYLLASPLSGAEIVLGKLAARLINLVVLVSVGLPVVSIALFLGGVVPGQVWLCYGLSFSTLYFLAGASIFASAFSARPRDAIVRTYAIEAIWLSLPLIERGFRDAGGTLSEIAEQVSPVTQWFVGSAPSLLLFRDWFTGSNRVLAEALWMIGLQFLYGTALLAWATIRLRPVECGARLWGFGWIDALGRNRPRRLFRRRPCGDTPMIWKECSGSLSAPSFFRLFIVIVLGTGAVVGLAYWAYAMGLPALHEVIDYGYGAAGTQSAREALNISVRIFTAVLYILSGLLMAAAAATSVTSEREKDTWVSLTATPLSGAEIIQGKFLGAIWRVRALLGALVLVWFLGVICGAVHPLGFLLAVFVTTVYLVFIALLGTYLSVRSRSSARAISGTIAILFFLNWGYLFCCIPMLMGGGPGRGSELVAAGMTPLIVTFAPFSFEDLDNAFLHNMRETPGFILTGIISLVFYGLTSVGLYQGCLSRFEIDDDRPRGEYLRTPSKASREGIVFPDEDEAGDEGIQFVEGTELDEAPVRIDDGEKLDGRQEGGSPLASS
jgi:ABC-type transport system involved in multi-copper enzyme maturation permease subunit